VVCLLRHLAIFALQSGKWIVGRILPHIQDQRPGVGTLIRCIKFFHRQRAAVLTLPASLSENWSRLGKNMFALMELPAISLVQVIGSFKKNAVQLMSSIRWHNAQVGQTLENFHKTKTSFDSAMATTDVNVSNMLVRRWDGYHFENPQFWQTAQTELFFALQPWLLVGQAALKATKVVLRKLHQQFARLILSVAFFAKVD
jgi:hypothetical protein